jgi:WXG100 family type VII secretion target
MAAIVQVQYDNVAANAAKLSQESANITDAFQQLAQAVQNLNGEWVGEGGDAFFVEMEGDILPAMQRLIEALSAGGNTLSQVGSRFQAVEQEGAAAFSK